MDIDYASYNNLDNNDLEKIIKYTKTLISKREKMSIDSIRTKNLDLLKESLEYNQEKKLSEIFWNNLSFRTLTYKQLDYFLFCTNLPQYDEKNKYQRGFDNFTFQAIESSFRDIELFTYFVKNSHYHNSINDIALGYAFNDKTSDEVINLLYKHQVINFDKKFLFEVARRQKENYLNFILNNNIVDLDKDDYQKLYMKTWSYINDDLLEKIKNSFPHYTKISLATMVKSFYTTDKKDYDQYKEFLKIKEEYFLRALKNHTINENDIQMLLTVFNNMAPQKNETFKQFVSVVSEQYPNMIEVIKNNRNLINSDEFKNIYESTINYIYLNNNLTDNNQTTKKVKL